MSIEVSGAAAQGLAFSNSATVTGSAAFAVSFWFKCPDNSAGSNFATWYADNGAFPLALSMTGKVDGTISVFYRDSSSNSVSLITGVVDDDALHCITYIKRAANDHELYVDFSSVATSATTVNTGGTRTSIGVFNAGGTNIPPSGARMAKLVTMTGVRTIEEIKAIMYGAQHPESPIIFCEMLEAAGTNEPDRSGNGYTGTKTGTIAGDHPPIAMPFGQDVFMPYVVIGGVIYSRTLSDSASASDQQQAYEEKLRVLFSGVTITDALSKIVAVIYEVVLSSNLEVNDSINTQKEIERLLLESIAVVDEVFTDKNLIRLLADNLSLVDAIARTIVLTPQIYNRILSDSTAIQDIILRETTGQIIQLILSRIENAYDIAMDFGTSDIVIGIETKDIEIDSEDI